MTIPNMTRTAIKEYSMMDWPCLLIYSQSITEDSSLCKCVNWNGVGMVIDPKRVCHHFISKIVYIDVVNLVI